jgi:hypothetical protein
MASFWTRAPVGRRLFTDALIFLALGGCPLTAEQQPRHQSFRNWFQYRRRSTLELPSRGATVEQNHAFFQQRNVLLDPEDPFTLKVLPGWSCTANEVFIPMSSYAMAQTSHCMDSSICFVLDGKWNAAPNGCVVLTDGDLRRGGQLQRTTISRRSGLRTQWQEGASELVPCVVAIASAETTDIASKFTKTLATFALGWLKLIKTLSLLSSPPGQRPRRVRDTVLLLRTWLGAFGPRSATACARVSSRSIFENWSTLLVICRRWSYSPQSGATNSNG